MVKDKWGFGRRASSRENALFELHAGMVYKMYEADCTWLFGIGFGWAGLWKRDVCMYVFTRSVRMVGSE